jgi:hypothetical protein
MTEWLSGILQSEAREIIESLRNGVPSRRYIARLTVGREDQISRLIKTLSFPSETSNRKLLIEANYGSGKSHLLRLIKEHALSEGYVVSLIDLNARGGVRFHLLQTVLSETFRQIELPEGGSGIRDLLIKFHEVDENQLGTEAKLIRSDITSNGNWEAPRKFLSHPLWFSLRAWRYSQFSEVQDAIVNFLENSRSYNGETTYLRNILAYNLRFGFHERRYGIPYGEYLSFARYNYFHSWNAFNDLDALAVASGYKGFVLLVDEVEDILTNLNNIGWQKICFENLFKFFDDQVFKGRAYFAVTPDFVKKCRARLLDRGEYYFPIDKFERLSNIKMSPVTEKEFFQVAVKICELHKIAYSWPAEDYFNDSDLDQYTTDAYKRSSIDQVRQATTGLVTKLDMARANYRKVSRK